MKTLLLSSVALALGTLSAFADTSWTPVTTSGTGYIKAGTPTVGGNYLDIENNGNAAQFRAYGVIEFQSFLIDTGGQPVGTVTSLTLNTVDTKSSFSTAGTFGFYFVTDSTTPLASLNYDPTAAGGVADLGGVNQSQFAPGTEFFYLGSATYTPVLNGTAISYTFNITGDGGIALADAIANGETLRFLLTPDNTAATQAITLAGAANGAAFGGPPTLGGTFAPVPEPSTVALLGLAGLCAIIAFARRPRLAA